MTITRDIVLDLLPLYLSGEASRDTCTLMDAYLADHPDIEAIIRRAQPLIPDESPPVAPDLEMEVLRRTKRLQLLQSWVLGCAIFLTASCFSFFVTDETGFRWIVASSPPTLALFALLGGISWASYAALRYRLR